MSLIKAKHFKGYLLLKPSSPSVDQILVMKHTHKQTLLGTAANMYLESSWLTIIIYGCNRL